ncbi:hypothetical protein R3W88_022316 [Solanum pinnatisectum]|uniref:Uncharacterized protein n=1 Tax=Solanum pinnatisectum TaxID=50273 RepID=A0AAV9LV85_9SOLN|nr:hypothetical protein R3W88_022316 [Solanum pinnatisectum]
MDFDLALSRQASKALLLKRLLRSFTRFPAARSYLTSSMIDVYNIWLYGVYRVIKFLLVCIKNYLWYKQHYSSSSKYIIYR